MRRSKEDKSLTRVEMEVMSILWDQGNRGMTTREILDRYPAPKPAYSTIATYMKILTVKGFVRSEKAEAGIKTFRFYTLISRHEYTAKFMREVKDSLFSGSFKSLLTFFAREEELSEDTLNQILRLIEGETEY